METTFVQDHDKAALEQTLGDFVRCRPCMRTPAERPVRQVLALMESCNLKACAVMGTEGEIAGLLTEKDILHEVLRQPRSFAQLQADDVMVADPCCLASAMTLPEAAQTLLQAGYRFAPVVDEEGALAGMVDVQDILRRENDCLRGAVENLDTLLVNLMQPEPYGRGATI